jgi:hypothetical protein
LLPPEQAAQMIEQAIVPSLEMWAKWEQEGVVKAGGVFAGERGGGFVLEAESAKEVGKLLNELAVLDLHQVGRKATAVG